MKDYDLICCKIQKAFDDADNTNVNQLASFHLSNGFGIDIFKDWDNEDNCWILILEIYDGEVDNEIDSYWIETNEREIINALAKNITDKYLLSC